MNLEPNQKRCGLSEKVFLPEIHERKSWPGALDLDFPLLLQAKLIPPDIHFRINKGEMLQLSAKTAREEYVVKSDLRLYPSGSHGKILLISGDIADKSIKERRGHRAMVMQNPE